MNEWNKVCVCYILQKCLRLSLKVFLLWLREPWIYIVMYCKHAFKALLHFVQCLIEQHINIDVETGQFNPTLRNSNQDKSCLANKKEWMKINSDLSYTTSCFNSGLCNIWSAFSAAGASQWECGGQRSNHSEQTYADFRLFRSLPSGTFSFSSSLHALFLALSWHSRFHLFMTADTVCLQVGMVPPVAMAAGKHKLTSLSHAGVRNSSQRERITFLSKPTHKIYNRVHAHTRTHACTHTRTHTQMCNCTHTYKMYNHTNTNHPSTWFSVD